MNKQELLDGVREAIREEESAVAVYMRHLSTMVLRSGLGVPEMARLRRSMDMLIAENKKHKQLLESMYDRVSREAAHDL